MLHAFFLIIHLVIGIAQTQQYDQSIYDSDIGGTFPSIDPSQSNLIGEFGNELAPGIDSIDKMSPNLDPLIGNDLRSRLFGPSMERRIFNPFNRILFSFLGPRLMRFQLDMMMQTLLSEVIRKMISPFITNAVGRLMNNDASNNGGMKGGLNLGLSTGQGSSGSQVSIGTGNGNGASMAPQISVMPSQMSNGQIQLIIKSGDSSNGGMTSVALGTPSNFANSATSLSGQNLPLQIPQISDNQLQQLMNAQLQQMLINKLPAQLVPQVQQQLQSQIQERIPLLQQQLRLQLQNQLGQQLANQIIPQSTMNGGVLSVPNDGLNQVGQSVANIPLIPNNSMDQPMLKLQVNPLNPHPSIHQPNSNAQTPFSNIASGYSIDSSQSVNRLPDNGPVLQMMVNSAQYGSSPNAPGNQGGISPISSQEMNMKYSQQSATQSINHNHLINTSAHNQVRPEDSRNLSNLHVSFGYPGLTSKTNGDYSEEKVQISSVSSSTSGSDHRGSPPVSITPVFQKSELNYDLSPPDSIDEGADNSSHTSMANYEHIKETIQQLTGEAQPQVKNEQHSSDNNGTSMEVAQSVVENQDLNNDNQNAKNESNSEPEATSNSSMESSHGNQDFRSENSNLHPILVYADFPHQQPSSIDQSMSYSRIPDSKSHLTHDRYSTSSQMFTSSSENNYSSPPPSSFHDGRDNQPLSSYHHDHNVPISSPVSPTLSSPSSYSHNSHSQFDQEDLGRQKITEDNVYPNSNPQSTSSWVGPHPPGTINSQNSQLTDFSDDKEESIQPINYAPKLSPEQEKERKERWQTMLKNLNRYYGY